MRLAIEAQLMRDWQPRSRPTVGYINLGEPEAAHLLLAPGAAATGTERMMITMEGCTRIDQYWATFRTTLIVEGTSFGAPRPGIVYLGESDIWTGVTHFPRMALDHSKMFRGWHSLLYRLTTPHSQGQS